MFFIEKLRGVFLPASIRRVYRRGKRADRIAQARRFLDWSQAPGVVMADDSAPLTTGRQPGDTANGPWGVE